MAIIHQSNKLPYVPILKAKQGEFKALATLQEDIKTRLVPFIDMPNNPRNEKGGKKPLETYIGKRMEDLSKAWGSAEPLYVDMLRVDSTERTSTGDHSLIALSEAATKHQVEVMFVTGLDRDNDYQNAFFTIMRDRKQPICLRLDLQDMQRPATLKSQIEGLLHRIAWDLSKIHLLLDFGHIPQPGLDRFVDIAIAALGVLEQIGTFGKIFIAGTAFPENLSGIKSNSEALIQRLECLLWERVSSEHNSIQFSDYGIQNPILSDVDPKAMNASGHIRYTLDGHFLILKGYSLKAGEKYAQFHSLAQGMIKHKGYSGKDYSWGDLFLFDCANRSAHPGRLSDWRAVGTSHHLTLVGNSLLKKSAA
jgi:hypothetical protein